MITAWFLKSNWKDSKAVGLFTSMVMHAAIIACVEVYLAIMFISKVIV